MFGVRLAVPFNLQPAFNLPYSHFLAALSLFALFWLGSNSLSADLEIGWSLVKANPEPTPEQFVVG